MPFGTYEEVIRAVLDRFVPGSLALPKAVRQGPVATSGRAPKPISLTYGGRPRFMIGRSRIGDQHVIG
jgi:hypothetical protein